MTPTQLKEAAQVMLAAAEGKQVQYMPRSTGQWVPVGWAENRSPSWDWHTHDYRIKPEPREWWMRQHRDEPCPSCGLFKTYQEAAQPADDQLKTTKIIKVREVI